MSSWSSKRKFTYGSIVVLALIIFVGIPIFYFTYKAPTCSDRKQNGDETGVDCGGSCVRLCQNSFITPNIVWGGAKFEKVLDGYYNASALIENKNINGSALNVPYKISRYDDQGILIVERNGTVTLYAHRNSLAFESMIPVGRRIPAKATFEWLQAPNWFKSHDALGGLVIINKSYNEDKTGSSLNVTIVNNTLFPYNNLSVSVILYDGSDNVIGFSRTNIDSISPNGRETAPFTWSIDRKGTVKTIDVVPIIAPTLDR